MQAAVGDLTHSTSQLYFAFDIAPYSTVGTFVIRLRVTAARGALGISNGVTVNVQ